MDRILAKQSGRFYKRLVKPAYPVPSLFMLMGFRMARTSMRLELDDSSYDYRYYKDKGWFDIRLLLSHSPECAEEGSRQSLRLDPNEDDEKQG